MSFGEMLRDLRLQAGLSQEALAELAQMSASGIGVLERGVRRAPQRQTLDLLAGALNLSRPDRERFQAAADRAGNARRPRAREAAAAVPNQNLPHAITKFVGSDGVIESLSKEASNRRLVTVTGTGGVGKTRIALEASYSLLNSFSDGVWIVELASIADPRLIAQRIGETLGVNASEPLQDGWIDALAEKHQLLILDGCEHLLTSCAEIAERLLARCPRLHILATSRERLHVIGEHVFPMKPLPEELAIELFLERASFADANQDVRAAVRRICTQLDGVPFAIELAAARVPSLSLKAIAENIGQRLTFLRHNATAPGKHQTMEALIDWSYELLPEHERRVLEQLSIFGSGCTLDSAFSIRTGNIDDRSELLECLASLVDKSLVEADFNGDDTRYSLLQTTRDYAREKLRERGEFDAVELFGSMAFSKNGIDGAYPTRIEHTPTGAIFFDSTNENPDYHSLELTLDQISLWQVPNP